MTLTNAQAALQAAVTLHARVDIGVNDETRASTLRSADAFLEWIEKNTKTWANRGSN